MPNLKGRRELGDNSIDGSLRIRELMTESEWTGFVEESQRMDDKDDKDKDKAIEKLDKALGNVRSESDKVIQDADKRNVAGLAIEEFKKELIDIQQRFQQINYNDTPAIGDQSATRAELQAVQDEIIGLYKEYFTGYLEVRREVLDVTTADEWEQINKVLSKIY